MLMRHVRVLSRHPSHKPFRRSILAKGRVTVRFGSTTVLRKPGREINTVEGIKNSSDKLRMKGAFDYAKVKNCLWVNSDSTIEEITQLEFPIVAKHRFGSKGSGNYKLDSLEELTAFIKRRRVDLNLFIFEKYTTFSREYRLHISKLGCFYACRKLRTGDVEQKNRWKFNNTTCVWILEENESFNKPDTWNNIVEDCQKAIKAVGLDLGCCDVRVSRKGDWKIIETNSAPALGEIGTQKYFNHLKELICVD